MLTRQYSGKKKGKLINPFRKEVEDIKTKRVEGKSKRGGKSLPKDEKQFKKEKRKSSPCVLKEKGQRVAIIFKRTYGPKIGGGPQDSRHTGDGWTAAIQQKKTEG